MDERRTHPLVERTRRQFFHECGLKLGAMGLASLVAPSAFANPAGNPLNPLAPRSPHFAPKAKSIIYLFMNGAPSQLDLFEEKPLLTRYDRQPIPEEYTKGERFAFVRGTPRVLASPYKFARHGQSGAVVSELLPHTAKIVDDLCFVRSCKTDAFNHAPAELFLNTGLARVGRPSMGSWLTYGLGSENQDLPGFVVLLSGGGQPSGGCSCWSSGFLPTPTRGCSSGPRATRCCSRATRRAYRRSRAGDRSTRCTTSTRCRSNRVGDPEIATRINAYEMAYRMQSERAGPAGDRRREARDPRRLRRRARQAVVRDQLPARPTARRARRALRAALPPRVGLHGTSPRRRHHDLAAPALRGDRPGVRGAGHGPQAARAARLDDRDLGRRVRAHADERSPQRLDVPGAGPPPARVHDVVRGRRDQEGRHIGKTDDLGYFSTADPLHVHDLHATILHLMGLDHKKLTFRFQGRDFRLTDVHGELYQPMLA
jgi:hypothetical protein